MKLIFLDTETSHLQDQNGKFPYNDVVLQLSYIIVDGNETIVKDVKCNPQHEISLSCMTVHHITEESVVGLPKVVDTEEYKILKEYVESGKYTFFAHNAKFDISVLYNIGIDVKQHCHVVDTLKVARIIHDNIGSHLEMYKLRYLIYKYKLHLRKQELCEKLGLEYSNTYHEAISDILDLMLYFKYLMKETDNCTLDKLIYLTENQIELTYVPFGSNINKKFSDLTYNQLSWYAKTDDVDVSYTAKLYL